MTTAQELQIDTAVTAEQMAEAMFGTGVQVVSASYTGADTAKGIYTGADTTSPKLAPSDSGVILSTGKATDITNTDGDPNLSNGLTTNYGLAGDGDLAAIAGGTTFDAASFRAEFIPQGSILTMQVTFSSEEYLEYVNGGFNDAVGVWVNGVKAELAVGDGDITINNINDQTNSNLYVDNPSTADLINTEMDGVTVTLTLKAPVNPGVVNSIKIAIADGGDGEYDSNLMIAADSVQTALIAGDDSVVIDPDNGVVVDVLANDQSAMGGTLTITHINGQAVMAGDVVQLGPGATVQLNPDGTLTVVSDGTEQPNAFSYTVADGSGNTDTAFVNTSAPVPCFVAGTLIDTPRGAVPVERLRPGDAVCTPHGGWARLRWVGIATRRAVGRDAPVRLDCGTFGATQDILLSPQHRVLVSGPQAALLFGEDEVLVRARDLIDGQHVVHRQDGRPVRYVHLLFDRHEIVRAHGLWSESYQPGPQTLSGFDQDARAELFRLFPELQSVGAKGWGPAARMMLKAGEAQVLLQALSRRPLPVVSHAAGR